MKVDILVAKSHDAFRLWGTWCSWTAIPPCWCDCVGLDSVINDHEDQKLKIEEHRSQTVRIWLILSLTIASVFWFGLINFGLSNAKDTGGALGLVWTGLSGVVLGLVTYRIIDLLIVLAAMSIFGGITKKRFTSRATPDEMSRIFILAVLNWVEIVFLFAAMYSAVGRLCDNAFIIDPFKDSIPRGAYFLSITTVSTIGYGNVAPLSGLSLAIASIQAVMALLLVSGLLGAAVGRLSSVPPVDIEAASNDSKDKHDAVLRKDRRQWIDMLDLLPESERRRRWFFWVVTLTLFIALGCTVVGIGT